MAATILIPLDDVEYDPKYQPRVEIDLEGTVTRYAEALRSDPKFDFPPIVVVKMVAKPVPYLVLDGTQRKFAYERAGRRRIPAVVEVLPESKWFARAVELNAAHGKPLTPEDQHKVIDRLQRDGWKADKIAALLKVRVESINQIKDCNAVAEPITAYRNTGKFKHHADPVQQKTRRQPVTSMVVPPNRSAVPTPADRKQAAIMRVVDAACAWCRDDADIEEACDNLIAAVDAYRAVLAKAESA